MHIDSYSFGKIVINGVIYNSDVIIIGDSVLPDWWRKEGHTLLIEDLQAVLEARPSVLVIGCGASGVMKVPRQTLDKLEAEGITLETLFTQKAAERFNELIGQDIDVAAALHLTC